MRREIEGAKRTDIDDLKLVRLPNWGRWGRQDSCKPDSQRLGSTIASRMGRDPDQDYDEPVDSVPEGIDERDAERLDGFIRQLSADHREIIRRCYYREEAIYRVHLDASVRALNDIIHANRDTVARMKRLTR